MDAKSFDSLGFSVAQMTRESPAFLISMNTGFMALSNNIPIFVDEVNRLVVANKELALKGEKTKSVLGAVGKAFLSWQSLISIGILFLTIYGGKMVEFVKDLIKGEYKLYALSECGTCIDVYDTVSVTVNVLNNFSSENIGDLIIDKH